MGEYPYFAMDIESKLCPVLNSEQAPCSPGNPLALLVARLVPSCQHGGNRPCAARRSGRPQSWAPANSWNSCGVGRSFVTATWIADCTLRSWTPGPPLAARNFFAAVHQFSFVTLDVGILFTLMLVYGQFMTSTKVNNL